MLLDADTRKLKKRLDKLAKGGSNFIIASPDTIEKMRGKGLPIKSKFIPYEEYLNKLFEEKKKLAYQIIGHLPLLSDKVANGTIHALYDEIRECYALGLFGATITLSVILLEVALKYKLFDLRKRSNPNAQWDEIEKDNFTSTVRDLNRLGQLSDIEKSELVTFNLETRNPYIHYNIQRLLKGLYLAELPVINITTGEIVMQKDVDLQESPHLWFAGKKKLDEKQVNEILNFCIGWVNKIHYKQT